MYYELNISKNGEHFFSTAPRSMRTKEKLIEVYNELKKRFSEDEYFIHIFFVNEFVESIDPKTFEIYEPKSF